MSKHKNSQPIDSTPAPAPIATDPPPELSLAEKRSAAAKKAWTTRRTAQPVQEAPPEQADPQQPTE